MLQQFATTLVVTWFITLASCSFATTPDAAETVAPERKIGELTYQQWKQRLTSDKYVIRWVTAAKLDREGPHDPVLIPLLEQQIKHGREDIRDYIERALTKIRLVVGDKALELKDVQSVLNSNGQTIAEIGNLARKHPRAEQLLRKALKSDLRAVRFHSALALWRLKKQPEMIRLMVDAVPQTKKGCARFVATRELGTLGIEAVQHLEKLAEEKTERRGLIDTAIAKIERTAKRAKSK